MRTFSFRDPAFMARMSGAGGPSAEPELSDWVSRVQGRGSDVTGAGVQTAVANFIKGCKTDSILDRAYRVGVYAGDALAALEAPLINTLGSTTDTLTGFVSGDYSSTGLVGGSGKRILTGFNIGLLSGGEENNFSMGVYVRTQTTIACLQMGCQTAGDATRGCYLYHDTSNVAASMWDNGTQVVQADSGAGGVGFYLVSRVASNDMRLFKNGSQFGSTSTSPGNNLNTFNFYVQDANLSNSPWVPSQQSFSFYWIGKGMNSTQQANLRTRVQTLQTDLSRQV